MRLYRNCQEAIIDIGRELKKCANEVHTQTMQNKQVKDDEAFNTKELQAFSFAILDPSDKDMMPNISLDWCKAEIEERLSGKEINPGEAYLLREDVWKEFLIETPRGKKFEYTYAERMYWQYKAVLKELQIHPETRQAIIQIHDRRIDQPKMGRERVPCFIKDTKIETKNGFQKIQDLKVGDKVYTHTGKLRKITRLHKRPYKGKIFKIRLDNNRIPIYTTPEHPFLALEHNTNTRNCKDYLKPGDPAFKIKENWVEAKDLRKHDYLIKVIPSTVKKVKYSKDLMRLFGYFLAEGEVCFDKRRGRNQPARVRFNMSTQDEQLGYNKDIREIMQKEFNLTKTCDSKKRKNIRISFCNKDFAEFIYKIFGTGSFTKTIPQEILNAPLDYQKELLIGFVRGDGHCKKETNSSMSCSTISPAIAMCIRRILERLKINSSVEFCKPGESIIYGRKVKFNHFTFRIYFASVTLFKEIFNQKSKATTKIHKREWMFEKDRSYNRIRSIEKEQFTGDVYNLSVEKDESYNLLQTTVHNCSLSYHLMRRNNALDIIYTMRSTDFITHFQNDIWLAIALQEWFAQQLNISLGKFIMFASSLHIYKRDWYQLSNY